MGTSIPNIIPLLRRYTKKLHATIRCLRIYANENILEFLQICTDFCIVEFLAWSSAPLLGVCMYFSGVPVDTRSCWCKIMASPYLIFQCWRYCDRIQTLPSVNEILPAAHAKSQVNNSFPGRWTPSYRNAPKFSDRQVWANSVDPDQTDSSDQGLHCLLFRLHLLDALRYGEATLFEFLGDYGIFFRCLNFYNTPNKWGH